MDAADREVLVVTGLSTIDHAPVLPSMVQQIGGAVSTTVCARNDVPRAQWDDNGNTRPSRGPHARRGGAVHEQWGYVTSQLPRRRLRLSPAACAMQLARAALYGQLNLATTAFRP